MSVKQLCFKLNRKLIYSYNVKKHKKNRSIRLLSRVVVSLILRVVAKSVSALSWYFEGAEVVVL
jgi:hypothetical protein